MDLMHLCIVLEEIAGKDHTTSDIDVEDAFPLLSHGLSKFCSMIVEHCVSSNATERTA